MPTMRRLPHALLAPGLSLLAGGHQLLDAPPAAGAGRLALVQVRHVAPQLGVVFIHEKGAGATGVLPLDPWHSLGPADAAPRPGALVMAQTLEGPRHGHKAARMSGRPCLASLSAVAWPGPARDATPKGFMATSVRPGALPSGPRRRARSYYALERAWESALLSGMRSRGRGGTPLVDPPAPWLRWMLSPGPVWALVPTPAARHLVACEMARYVPGAPREIEVVDLGLWRTWAQAHLAATCQPRVPLPSGGSLVLERTEACWTLDVNTGDGSVRRATEEAPRCATQQMALRSLGGVVLVDFPGGVRLDRTLGTWAGALAQDPAHTALVGWGQDGWLRLVRPRRGW